MGQNERLDLRARSNLSNRIAARQRVLHASAEMLVLDFRAAHVTAMHQHVGAAGNTVNALTGNCIAADGDYLAFGLEPVSVTLPSLHECRREAEPVAVDCGIGADLPAIGLQNQTWRNVFGDDRPPSAKRRLSQRAPL